MDESRKVIWVGAGVLGLLAVAAVLYFFVLRDGGDKAADLQNEVTTGETTPAPESAEKIAGEAPEPIDVPLDGSDAVLREMASSLSQNPRLAQWLVTGELVRKFVAAVDNVANGQTPRRQVDFFKPEGSFQVVERNGIPYVDPEGFSRYDPVAEVFASLDTDGGVVLYHRMELLIQEAYSDLGYPGQNFHATLLRAVDQLLDVPVEEGAVGLERKLLSYVFTDPRLETLSEAQKHLFRMGPDNVRRIQAKLREFRMRLED